MTLPSRIYLSPPHVSGGEIEGVRAALESNWVAPLGPEVDRFEQAVAETAGRAHAAATNTGTAALHLGLRLVGVGPADEVLMPTLTFVATANAASYLGARPVFLDVSPDTWTLDPDLLRETLAARAASGRRTAAVVTVDLYGQCSDYDRLAATCAEYDVPLVVDAAEALGASYRGRPAGSAGHLAVFSFNGNKIITTSGGGMLVGDDGDAIRRARSWASQARTPATYYEHDELGYNYRLSNLLAAVGVAQLATLESRVARRRTLNRRYAEELGALPGVTFMPIAAYGVPTHWLTVMSLGAEAAATPQEVVAALNAVDIEARPAWKPMHLQPLFRSAERVAGAVSEHVFASSVCLPSGSSLSDADQTRVIERVMDVLGPGSSGPDRVGAAWARQAAQGH